MAVIVLGANTYTQTSTRKAWDKERGRTVVKTYKGPIDPTDTYYESLVDNEFVDSISIDESMGYAILEITYLDEEGTDSGSGSGGVGQNTRELNTIWEIVSQDLYKNLRAFPGTVDPATVKFNLDANQRDLEEVRVYVESGGLRGTLPAGSPMDEYYNLLIRQTQQYVRSAMILRSSIAVGSRSLVTAAWEGVDYAWTLNGTETEADAAETLGMQMGNPNLATTGDATIIGAVAAMPEFDATKKQWLKRAPQIRAVSRRRYSIVQDWWYARDWSHILYLGDDVAGNP